MGRKHWELTWAVVLPVLLLLTVCGDGGSEEESQARVSDINEILVSEPTVVDVTPYSGRVLAETRVDVVCAVAYGPTMNYGQLATDLDMAGSGHRDHQPLLVGLQPDTEYHYKFGGVDSEGRLFSSDDFTFRTPPAATGDLRQPSGDNRALQSNGARVISASSIFGGGDNDSTWGANNAIDGDPRTQWSTSGDGNDASIDIELAAETRVTSLGFWTRTMGDSAQVFSFRVVTDRCEVFGPFSLDDAAAIHYFDTDITAKRLRFEAVATSGGNTGVLEIEVYGEPAP